jgi:Zn-dependent peptidase ImmA (M78 family)/DNA-binding XRE family transcriptional regulator
MTTILKAVNPDMIAIGRESRKLTQTKLAQLLEIPQGQLSKIESGIMPIMPELLQKIAHELNYPENFFSLNDIAFGLGPSMFFHRKRQSLSIRLLKYIHAQINIRTMQIQKLLGQGQIECKIPHVDPEEFNGDVETIATRLRVMWLLPDGPVQSVTRTIENAGGIVVKFDFETRLLDAISLWPPNMPPLFFINADVPTDRLRHTLCHELAHMTMHYLSTDADLKRIENQANRFAGAFLLPAKEVAHSLSQLTLPKLAALKRYWKVSMGAIIERAFQLGKISERNRQYLWTQMAKAGYKTREPIPLDKETESPALLKEVVEAHRFQLQYSPREMGSLVGLSEREFRVFYLNESLLRAV